MEILKWNELSFNKFNNRQNELWNEQDDVESELHSFEDVCDYLLEKDSDEEEE